MLPVSPAFEAALRGSRAVTWRATVHDKKNNPMAINLAVHDWSLHLDVDAVPQGVLTLEVIDENFRLDVSASNSGKWLSRLIKFEWGLYVNNRYEYVPLIYGPIEDAAREGARINFRVVTKDAQGVDPYFFRRSFGVRKHTRIHRVIRAIAEHRGETMFDLESVHRRLNKDRTWAPGQEPWRVMQNLAGSLEDHQVYYRGNGRLRLRRKPSEPAWKFTDDHTTTIIGHPSDRVSIEPVRNEVLVRGEKQYKRMVERRMELDEKAAIGATSVTVKKLAEGVADGLKITIGKGDKEETRTIAGSYTSGSKTIPLVRALSKNHPVSARVQVTVKVSRVRPVIGRATINQNHPLSPEALTDGKRPRTQILDSPNIHRKDSAEEKAEKRVRQMRVGVENETGLDTLLIPHLELGDIVLAETASGRHRFRLKTMEMSKDGRMVINRRRRYTPKRTRKKGRGPKARVKRVRVETEGGVLDQPLTSTWSDGSNLSLEVITDFSLSGGAAVIDPGAANEETIYYSSGDEAADDLVGVSRPNPKPHAAGAFVQAGTEPTTEKIVDAYVDDEDVAAVGIPVPSSKYGYLSTSTIEADEKVITLDVDESGELSVLEGPTGEPPVFDEDLELLPAVGGGDASQSTPDSAGKINPPPGMGFEDKQPPSGTVTPVVIGGLGNTLHVRFTTLANSSIVTYKVHAHTTLGFTPDATTQVGTVQLAGTPDFTHSFSFKDFPSGHVLDGSVSDPPQPGTVYEVCILPSDGSGDAPGPYPRATGAPLKIDTIQIDDLAITSALLAASAVTETKIASDAVSSPKIVAGAIQTGHIAAGAVETAKLHAGAVTADKIAANAITSDKIAANTIVAADIAAGTITGDRIAGTTITADKLSVSSLSAITANLGTVTAGSITGVTITGGTIRTAASGTRVELTGSAVGELTFYSSSGGTAGSLTAGFGGDGLGVVGYGTTGLVLSTNGAPVEVRASMLSANNIKQTTESYLEQSGSLNPPAPSTGHRLYHDNGALKIRFGNGVIKTIATNA